MLAAACPPKRSLMLKKPKLGLGLRGFEVRVKGV